MMNDVSLSRTSFCTFVAWRNNASQVVSSPDCIDQVQSRNDEKYRNIETKVAAVIP